MAKVNRDELVAQMEAVASELQLSDSDDIAALGELIEQWVSCLETVGGTAVSKALAAAKAHHPKE